jgi:hypothetical protein
MLDDFERVMCRECGGSMRCVKSVPGVSEFECEGIECNHKVAFTWPQVERQAERMIIAGVADAFLC